MQEIDFNYLTKLFITKNSKLQCDELKVESFGTIVEESNVETITWGGLLSIGRQCTLAHQSCISIGGPCPTQGLFYKSK